MTLHEKELTEPRREKVISPSRKQVELYRHKAVGAIDLSKIGPRPNQISEGFIDVSSFSEIECPSRYWTRGNVFTEKSDLILIVASRYCRKESIPKSSNAKLYEVPPKKILDGLGFKLGDFNRRGEWDVDWTPYFR